MKKVLIFAAAMALVAATAFAGGVDLSVGGCPGNAGVTGGAQTYDCTSGAGITMVVTFAPNENISDLVGIGGIVDAQAAPDLTTSGFWNFDPAGCNPAALANSHVRPSGCTSPVYTATWSVSGSGEGIACVNRGPAIERMAFTCFRPSILSVTAGQKLFGTTISIDGTTATEAGGTCAGCPNAFFLVVNDLAPSSNGATVTTDLGGGTGSVAGIDNTMGWQGGLALCCAVPTHKHTWGQLKSLYR